jgi:hypothetical protein
VPAARQSIITTATKSSFSLFIRSSIQNEIMARRIIALAEVAHVLRQTAELELLGQQLESIDRYNAIGIYYQGLARLRAGRGDLGAAEILFERASEHAQPEYRARAILSLAAVEGYRGNPEAERRHYARALSIEGADQWARIESARAVALLHSFEGDHSRALELLESIHPIARRSARTSPRLYLDLLNSLAVEYVECGRIEEAKETFKPVLRSTLINSIVEFRETAQSLAEAEQRAAAVIVTKSDKRSSAPSETARLAEALDHRQNRRVCRRNSKPDKCDSTTARQEACTCRPVGVLIARNAEANRSRIIERVQLCAPIHAPPFISVV